jgi:hypothetical protein
VTLVLDHHEIAEAIEIPFERWSHQCHLISLKIVQAGFVPGGRVARGSAFGVGGQHSWIVDGRDCYAPDAKIIDPTLWSYVDGVDPIWTGTPKSKFGHTPHGAGSIWAWGKPTNRDNDSPSTFLDRTGLSKTACNFLDLIEPLNTSGWMTLFSNAPVEGWPAGEIIEAAVNAGMGWMIPVDRIGMLTDLNPEGLYE